MADITAEQVARLISANRDAAAGRGSLTPMSNVLGDNWRELVPPYVLEMCGGHTRHSDWPDFIAALTRWHAELVAAETPDDTIAPRPVVQRFALLMEEVLRANDHKTGRLDMDVRSLMERLEQEVAELREVIDAHVPSHGVLVAGMSVAARQKLMREAADVANFALMIADETEWRIGNERAPVAATPAKVARWDADWKGYVLDPPHNDTTMVGGSSAIDSLRAWGYTIEGAPDDTAPERLRERREALGWTRRDASDATGLHADYGIGMLEEREYAAMGSPDNRARYAAALSAAEAERVVASGRRAGKSAGTLAQFCDQPATEAAPQPEPWHARLVRLAQAARDASAAYDAAKAANDAAEDALATALRACQEAHAALREATEATAIVEAAQQPAPVQPTRPEPRYKDAQGYARAMGEVDTLLKIEGQSAVGRAANGDERREWYAMAMRDARAAVQGLARARARERLPAAAVRD